MIGAEGKGMRRRAAVGMVCIAVLAGVLVACGDDDADSNGDAGTTETTGTAPTTTAEMPSGGPLDGVPAPAGGSSTGTESIPEAGELASYDTLSTPQEVVEDYGTQLTSSGWTIVGGDAGGQGAGGTGLQATMGDRYLSVDAGESAVGSTFVSVCGWPEEPSTPQCTFIDQGTSTTGG